jgi:hypothetical protein
MLVFVVEPHVPDCSPVVISSIPILLNVLAMPFPYVQFRTHKCWVPG